MQGSTIINADTLGTAICCDLKKLSFISDATLVSLRSCGKLICLLAKFGKMSVPMSYSLSSRVLYLIPVIANLCSVSNGEI